VRLGTPAVTTRGLKRGLETVAEFIDRALLATRDYIGDYHGREPWVKIPVPELWISTSGAAAPVRPAKVIGICSTRST